MPVATPARPRTEPSTRQLISSLVPLGATIAVIGTSAAFVSPFLSLFLSRELRADPVHTAVFLFVTPLATVILATLLGRVSDRPAMRRRLMLAGSVAGVIGYTGYAFVRDYRVLLAVSVTLLAVAGSLYPQVFAYARQVLDRSGSTRAPMAISTLRMLLSVSWVAGPPLAAFLLGVIGFTGLFAVTAVGHLLVTAIVVGWLAEVPTRASAADPEHDPEADSATAAPSTAAPSTAPGGGLGRALVAAFAFTLMQSAAALAMLALPLYMSEDLHSSVRGAGLVLGLCAALEIPLMILFGALAGRWPLFRLVLLGGLFGVAYYATVSIATNGWQVAAAQVLNACFISAVTGLGISYFQDLLPRALGTATTLFTNTNRVSAMLAGPIFGLVQHFGYRLAYTAATGLCLLGVAVLAVSAVVVPRSVRTVAG